LGTGVADRFRLTKAFPAGGITTIGTVTTRAERPAMSRKRNLTREEWIQAGNAVKEAQDQIWEVVKLLGVSLPVSHGDRLMKVSRRLDVIKSGLESAAARQHCRPFSGRRSRNAGSRRRRVTASGISA
jgi:hypothetical protein